jgi:hypothetical protein
MDTLETASVVSGSGRKTGRFSRGAHCFGSGLVGSMGYGAERGWLGGGVTVPFGYVQDLTQFRAHTIGNASTALGGLGCTVTAQWRGAGMT